MLNINTNEPKLTFVSQAGNTFVFYSDRALNLGELIVVNESSTAVVNRFDGSFYMANLYSKVLVKKIRIKNWWSPNQGKNFLLADRQFFIGDKPGLINVCCNVPDLYNAGGIGWRLDVENIDVSGTLIAGSDWTTPARCTYKVPGYWPPGLYTLNAVRFNPYGYSKFNSAHLSWTVTNTTRTLESEVPLNLI